MLKIWLKISTCSFFIQTNLFIQHVVIDASILNIRCHEEQRDVYVFDLAEETMILIIIVRSGVLST